MQVVAPDESVWLVRLCLAEMHALDDLRRQIYSRVMSFEPALTVPAEWLLLYWH